MKRFFVDTNLFLRYLDAYNAAWVQANTLDGVYSFDRKHFSRLLPGQYLEP